MESAKELELIDAFTNDVIREPVLAADGHVYSRSSLLKFFAARKADGMPVVSPQDMATPMGEELREAPRDVCAALSQLESDDQMRRARKARGASFKSLEALKGVFDVLDPLAELLAATLEGWQTPVVIVFGGETSGKSSLLERLAMMPLLPRDEETCTRLPIMLKLRHTKEARLPVLVVRDAATGKEEVRRTVSLAGGQLDVRREMERVVTDEHNGLTSVSTTRTIEVHVYSPAVPSIDLVDMPGLKASAGKDAADMPEKARALVKAQIEQHEDSAVFLVTCTAATSPLQSLGLQMVEELGLQSRTIGVVTMCDAAGKLDLKKIPGRVLQTAADAFTLSPHGYVATMTEPVEDEGLSNMQKLHRQAVAERAWFASQPVLAPLAQQGLVTCDVLVDKLSTVYATFLRSTWAPGTLFRLNREIERLRSESDALGLPEADSGLQGADLTALRAAACKAAEAVLDAGMHDVATSCHSEVLKPMLASAMGNGGTGMSGFELEALQMRLLTALLESRRRYVAAVQDKLRADTSSVKLGRFPRFIGAIVSRLQALAVDMPTQSTWSKQTIKEVVREAASEVEDWTEACAAQRVALRRQMVQVEPVKAKTLELLNVKSENGIPALAQLERAASARCVIEGPKDVKVDKEQTFTVTMSGGVSGLTPNASLRGSGRTVVATVAERGGGAYEVRCTPPAEGEWELCVMLHGWRLGTMAVSAMASVTLRFQSAFDKNGVLYHIATQGGTRKYRNPHGTGDVVASMSSSNGNAQYSDPHRFVQHLHASPVYNYTNSQRNSWMAVDLGAGRAVCPSHYCLRSDQHPTGHTLRHWRLEGSKDGQQWTSLREHSNDSALAETPMSVADWPLDAATVKGRQLRHFRIFQTGKSSSNQDHVMCAGIEIYGVLSDR